MPCWNIVTVTTTTLENVGTKNKNRLVAAAKEHGASLYFYGDAALAEVAGHGQSSELCRQIMQSYTRMTIEAGARKFGLKIKSVKKDSQKKTVHLTVGR